VDCVSSASGSSMPLAMGLHVSCELDGGFSDRVLFLCKLHLLAVSEQLSEPPSIRRAISLHEPSTSNYLLVAMMSVGG
jgi:hypothetical protein